MAVFSLLIPSPLTPQQRPGFVRGADPSVQQGQALSTWRLSLLMR